VFHRRFQIYKAVDSRIKGFKMSRQLEQDSEDRDARRWRQVCLAVDHGLQAAVEHNGGVLTGMAVKTSDYEVLITLKAVFPGGPMVAFVGAPTVGDAFVKGMMDANRDKLRWRPDKYVG
jgi:hypothetical protein